MLIINKGYAKYLIHAQSFFNPIAH